MIIVKQVAKSFGEFNAVDHVSLELPDQTCSVILGPSGTGKTTLLRLIAGLEMPDSGEIYIDGALVSRPGQVTAPHLRNLGFVFQSSSLWPHMTVAQNILFGLHGLPKNEAKNRLFELLENTSLTGLERRYPHQLSGGEARRVALVRTLASKPKNLLMDEPLTNVDPDLKARLLAFLNKTVQETHACLLYVTHDAEEAAQISDRIFRMENGNIKI
jgi:ABC-type sugar transport system ATPase subunit